MTDEAKALVAWLREEADLAHYRAEEDMLTEAADTIEVLATQLAEARAALEKIALGLSIELDQEDGPVEVWLDAEELSDIARAALKGSQQ